MGRHDLVGVCTLAVALAIVGAARSEEMRVASLTPSQAAASAQGSDQVSFGFARVGRDDQLTVSDAVPSQPGEDARSSHKRAAKAKHAPCVHGEWVTPEDYNPWTLACRPVGEF